MAKLFFTYFPGIEGIVHNGRPMGGSLVQTLVWMRAMHELGHEVFLAKYEGDERAVKEEFNWIQTVEVYHPRKYKKRLVWFTYRFPKYFSTIKSHGFDYVYISMPHWSVFFIGLICKFLKVPQILRIANDNDLDRSLGNYNTGYQNFFQDRGVNVSAVVLAQNQFQYDFLKSKYKVKKLVKVSNPIVLDKNYLQAKKAYRGYIAWLANFRRQKNLALLFELAQVLRDEQFRIAGQPILPMDEESEKYYQELLKLPNVEFVGVLGRSEVLEFLDGAKYLLSTSRYEGFSNTFLESMVVGTPILTTSNVNPDGIISRYGLGIVYSDSSNLKVSLDSMRLDEYLALSGNCITYVKQNHDHLKLGKKILDLLLD